MDRTTYYEEQRKKRDELKKKVKELRKQGLTIAMIADKLGLCESTVLALAK